MQIKDEGAKTRGVVSRGETTELRWPGSRDDDSQRNSRIVLKLRIST